MFEAGLRGCSWSQHPWTASLSLIYQLVELTNRYKLSLSETFSLILCLRSQFSSEGTYHCTRQCLYWQTEEQSLSTKGDYFRFWRSLIVFIRTSWGWPTSGRVSCSPPATSQGSPATCSRPSPPPPSSSPLFLSWCLGSSSCHPQRGSPPSVTHLTLPGRSVIV